MNLVPPKVFLTKGVGRHKEKLASYEEALRNAGIAQYNLVHVSSIFPPGCKLISKAKGLEKLAAGEIVHCVMAENATNEYMRLIVASIGLAKPKNSKRHGYLSEHHAFGMTKKEAGDYAEDLAAKMLGTTMGIEIDPEDAYNEKKEVYEAKGKVFTSRSIAQSASGKKDLWTTVLAAAVFILNNDYKQ